MGYMTLKSRSDSRQGQDISFLKVSKPDLGPVQHRVQWLPASLLRGTKAIGVWSRLPTSSQYRGSECVELYFHSHMYLYAVMFN